MHDYSKLEVFHQSVRLASDVISFADSLPSQHRFGLIQQLQRSAISVPSNIAEGSGRGDRLDFARFLRIAIGSTCEVDAQLYICEEAHLGPPETVRHLRNQAISIRKRVSTLEARIKART